METKAHKSYIVMLVSSFLFRACSEHSLKENHWPVVLIKFWHLIVLWKLHELTDWPSRDDIDDVHISCVFCGPVTLESAGPFAVPKQQNFEKMFKEI